MNMKIVSERLILREWKLEDADDIVEGLSDFETAKNLTVPFPYTKEHANQFINAAKSNPNKQHFAITLKNTGEVIGGTSIEIHPNNKVKGGIWIKPSYTQKGYGTEAFKARAKFIFENLHFDEIENGYFDFNLNSAKMQEKIGYEIVGKKKTFCPAMKKEVTEIVTKLTRERFLDK